MGSPTLSPGLIRPPASRSTVARSSARRSGFSQPNGVTAVPSSIREVRWLAAAIIAMGEEMPNCRWRWRSQALSNPSRSPSSMIRKVDSWPGAGFAGSNRPIVRNPSLRKGREGSGMGLPSGSGAVRLTSEYAPGPVGSSQHGGGFPLRHWCPAMSGPARQGAQGLAEAPADI